ncbi:hypothetical protein [Nocardioides sp. GY 10127]|uniref:hypothetical protein n=1 Tax=Nocardioides sp. GY 10127 TaxID=2569762 RepID=UPI0010A80634|nr:hypothetical protein [Nocardioides sp. GY 10127]TIC81577.1 hypothetical protein E8D37_10170 [Nocardioides sp. GY 10127]
MSATSASSPSGPATIDVSATSRVPFGRLVSVEWRKMTDTRAGFWLMLVTGLLLLAAIGITELVVQLNDLAIGFNGWVQVMVTPLTLLLPVFPIIAVTSEWGQRTGLVTFTLEPHRLRVVLAKLVAVVIFAVAIIAVSMGLAVLANVVNASFSGYDTLWNLEAHQLVWIIVQLLAYFLMAFGLALVTLSSPGGIAFFYVVALLLPVVVYSILMALLSWAPDVIPYFDMNYSMTPYQAATGDPTLLVLDKNPVAVVTSVLLWVVAPFVLGLRRVLRSEPK